MFLIYLFLLLINASHIFYTSGANQQNVENHGQELLLCRKCGADVADSHYIFTKIGPGARKTDKKHLFGRHNITVQTLVNPFGVKFDIITTEKASCQNIGPNQGADSWFPGYTWRICTCPHCGQHLGWTFESNVKDIKDSSTDQVTSFHGLILNNILGENYSLMMPKMYRV